MFCSCCCFRPGSNCSSVKGWDPIGPLDFSLKREKDIVTFLTGILQKDKSDETKNITLLIWYFCSYLVLQDLDLWTQKVYYRCMNESIFGLLERTLRAEGTLTDTWKPCTPSLQPFRNLYIPICILIVEKESSKSVGCCCCLPNNHRRSKLTWINETISGLSKQGFQGPYLGSGFGCEIKEESVFGEFFYAF